MNITKRISVLVALMVIFTAGSALGEGTDSRRPGGRHHGPPPEAFTACEDKTAGDTAEFESPRGDTITGTCEQQGDRLVLRPDNPPPRRHMAHGSGNSEDDY